MTISDTDLSQIKIHAAELEQGDQARLATFNEADNMYLMVDADLPNGDWIKDTISPDARNAEDGAFRLLAAADPIFTVPTETNDPSLAKDASLLERAARRIWEQAGQITLRPRHYDAIRSGLHYGEVHILVHSVKALVDLQKGGTGTRKRAEQALQRTPVLFEIVNPREGHAQWGLFGLTAYYSKRTMTASEIRARFPLALAGKKSTDAVFIHDYWSLDWHCVWCDEDLEPYVAEPNVDAIIPVAAVLCEGGRLFYIDGVDNSRQPFLYTVMKSSLWKRLNLFLTVMNSQVFYVGSKPLLVYEGSAETPPLVDRSEGAMVMVKPGEKIYPLAEKILDPALVQMLQIVDAKFEQSTIYKSALGGMLGAGTAYSTVALMSQQGRLPLIVYQRMLSMAIAEAMRLAFAIAKRDKTGVTAGGENGLVKLDWDRIPDYFDLKATLEIDQATDDRVNSQVAAEGIKSGLWSKRYGREKYARIGQSDTMDDEITQEQIADTQTQIHIQQMIAKAQQELQAQAGNAGATPGNGAPAGAPTEPPPDLQSAQPGLPMAAPAEPGGTAMGPGGMPPDMAGGGQ